jgi:hypothetical protein
MRRLAFLALLLSAPAFGSPAPFQKGARPDRGASKARILEERGRMFARSIRPGMSKTHVKAILGDPSSDLGDFFGQDWRYDGLEILVRFDKAEGVVTRVYCRSAR